MSHLNLDENADSYDLLHPSSRFRLGPTFSPRVGSLKMAFWLIFLSLLIYALLILFVWSRHGDAFFEPDGVGRNLIAPSVALMGIGLGSLLKVYDSCDQRLGIVDALMHEIVSICRLVYTSQAVRAYRGLYFMPNAAVHAEGTRTELYMVQYDQNAHKMGFLSPSELSYVVTFYIMLKGSRDLAQSINNWKNLDGKQAILSEEFVEARKRWDIISLTYAMFMAFENAYYAAQCLSQNKRQREATQRLLMTLMCDCYVFLEDVMEPLDERRRYLASKRRRKVFSDCNKVLSERQERYRTDKAALLHFQSRSQHGGRA